MPDRDNKQILDRIAQSFERLLHTFVERPTRMAAQAGTQIPILGLAVRPVAERLDLLPEPGSFEHVAGTILGNLVPAGVAYGGARVALEGARAVPQAAAALSRLSPLGRAVVTDIAAAPIYEALRWSAGEDPNLSHSLSTLGGSGLGALLAEQRFGPRRLPILGGALLGAALGAQPFVDPENRLGDTLSQALPLGASVGLLSPLRRPGTPPPSASSTPSPQRDRIEIRTPEPVQMTLPFPDREPIPPEVLRREAVPSPTPGPAMLRREIPKPEAPVQLDLDFGESIAGNPAAKAADFIAQGGPPGLFRPTFEVVGDKKSLPRNIYYKLPRRLQEQLEEVDVNIQLANSYMERLLRQHKVQIPSQLPDPARVEYEQAASQILQLAQSRDELKPAIIGALERRKDLGPAILEIIESEKAAGVVATRLPSSASTSDPPVPLGTPGRTPIRDEVTARVHEQLDQPRPGEVAVTEDVFAREVDPTHLGLAKVPDPKEGRVVAYAWEMNLDEVARNPDFVRVTRTPTARKLTLSNREYIEEMRASSPGIQGYYMAFSQDLFGRDIYQTITTEAKKMTTFTRLWTDRLINILQKHKTTSLQARERIGRLLDGQEVQGATTAERAAATEVRRLFYGEGPGQALHGEFGIPASMWLQDYLPHVRSRSVEELDRMLATMEPRYRNFFAEFHRRGDITDSYDVLDVGLRYLRAGAKKKFLEPALEQIQPLVDQMHPDRRRLFEGMVNNVFGRPSDQERLIDSTLRNMLNPIFRAFGRQFPDRPTQEISRFTALATHLGTLAFNVNSALKNWTQRFHAAALTSPADFLWAERARRTDTGKFLLRYNEVAQQRLFLEGMELEQRIIKRTLGNLAEAGMSLFERADAGNVQVSYLAGVRQALRQGKSWAEAIEHGNYIARTTQFEYGLNQPAFLRTPVGRVLGTLQSYPLHMARMMYEQASGEEKWRAVALVATMAGVKHLYEKLTGLHAPVSIPETLASHPALPGTSLAPPAQLLADAANWVVRFTQRDPVALDEAKESLLKSLSTFIPGSVQLRRIRTFVERAMNDWAVTDERGRQLYRVTESEAIRGLIGPTIESQERWSIRNDLSLLVQELADPGSTRSLFHPESWVRPSPQRIRAEAQALLRRAAQHGMDPKKLQDGAIARTRQYYYSKFWPAIVEGDYDNARRFAEVLKRLGVTQENIMRSGEASDMHPALVMQGAVLFGPGIPRLSVPSRPSTTSQLSVPSRPSTSSQLTVPPRPRM